ncbi:septation protein SepH [Bifidobacterium callimiconis]|uniref:DUF3071 domain-containing protein n=1 Tax=Bifidobacterium callimiconis TaxID=2306973 RepID=A0A430FD07_9BIFI|nr:septation protein SepH [Bifidobacterium callimiconis]MBT1176845.1 DUF3071 domain-containing protein [Bifidobacterium callimiconis]RSX50744.1 hypothetical protein D2E23_1409 [Bifidobacterium callimiconis]
MSDETLKVAHFERVDKNGDLVFSMDGHSFLVRIDDRLEQGILASKQIRVERGDAPDPQSTATIPISMIQSMIRAGASPSEVAKNYSVSEVLVRRFAQPVETEKKYAINQFFSAPASTTSRSRSVLDVVEASLRAAHIPMDTVRWSATRHTREPWRIHASFETAGRLIKAEWAWDMRDNSVTPMNTTAGMLLKAKRFEPNGGEPDESHSVFGRSPDVKNSVNDVHISDSNGDSSSSPNDSSSSSATQSPADAPTTARNADDHNAAGGAPTTGDWLYGDKTDNGKHGQTAQSAQSDVKTDDQVSPLVPNAQTDGHADGTDAAPAKPRRKSRRSAVPSWDEILFGE